MNRDEFFATLAPLDAEQRVTFRRLATEAQSALHATDSGLWGSKTASYP